MNSEWQSFLQAQGASIDADQVRFPPSSGDNQLFDLSHLGLIQVEGAETDSFLQGQLSNDLRELTETHSQMSSHCSPKGRMIANFRMLRRDDKVLLQLPKDNLPPLLKRLSMFKLRAQVDLSDAGDSLMRMGLAGPKAREMLFAATDKAPELENSVQPHGELTILRMPGATPRFEILGPVKAVSALWSQLSEQGAGPANSEDWALLEIRAGIPTVYADTSEAFVPQMANMQLVDGVSFTKGCYTGQEVVARMQYLGKLKRRMYLARVDSDNPPKAGDELYAPGSESGQGAGRIVDAQANGAGGFDLLAVMEISAADAGDVRLGEDGPRLSFMDLPYALAQEENTDS